MNIDIGAKREHKRLKRLSIIRGRLTAFGKKAYPADVLLEVRRAERLRKRAALPPEPAPQIPVVIDQKQFEQKSSSFFKRLLFKKKGESK